MRAAVAALSWELLRPHRWLLSLTALALVVFCAVSLLLPESARHPGVGVVMALALGVPLLVVLGVLAHGGQGRLEAAASSFPVRLFTLPVPTPVLVGPPLVLGTTVILVGWLSCAACLLRPSGIEVPLLWPGFLAAAGLALLQAFVWYPLPLPWLRLVVLICVAPGMAGAVALVVELKVSEPLLVTASLMMLLTGYAWAAAGVRKARRGVGVHEPVFVGPVAVSARGNAPPPFTSPLRAQLWLEWRMRGWIFSFVAVLCLGITLLSLIGIDKVLSYKSPSGIAWLEQAREAVGNSWLAMVSLLLVPFLAALIGGPDLGVMTAGGRSDAFPAFLVRQPMQTADMVKAKLLLCARGVIGLWGVQVLGGLGWAVCMGRVGEMTDRLVAWTGSGPAALGVLLGGLALLAMITWLWLIHNLWAGALGRYVVALVPVVLSGVFWSAAVWLVLHWREEWLPLLGLAVSAALVGKVLAVVWVVRRLRRERMIQTRSLTSAIAGWVLLTAAVMGVGLWLLSASAVVAGCVVLMMPLARCLAAPLALAHNRVQ